IAQEAFIKLSQYWRGELTPGPAVSAWLYKAAHNIAIDHIRHEKTRAEAHKKHYEEREIERGAAKSDDSQNDDDAAKIRAALAALPERERALVVLKVYENKSYGEIGQITGLKTGNVGYILHNAMKKLAQIMSNKKGGDGK
ncbi:MAG: sigma-70 family RNA polymerase sigma factor, partial [Kiritimatiellaeota bacterium]|nr:sigma-70 family RNA polymerase sigma factor [Kiritimatiellota bacterium]